MEIINREFKARSSVNQKSEANQDNVQTLPCVKSPQKDLSSDSNQKGKESCGSKTITSPRGEKLQMSATKSNKENTHQTSMLNFVVACKAQEANGESSHQPKESTSTARKSSKECKIDKENDKLSSNKLSSFFSGTGKGKLDASKPVE